jgi:ABC-type polysaccharide/polyol phosphate export permease
VYADVVRYRELFGSLFRRDLRAKYRGSFLGLAWSLLHPLVLMAVYLLVFSVLWRVAEVGSDDYWLFLLCGLPPWVFFATAVQRRPGACSRTPTSSARSASRAS